MERRTIVVVASAPDLTDALLVLGDLPGERPLVAVAVSNGAASVIWRGVAARAPDHVQDWPARERYVLIVGGAREQVSRWDEDQLRSQVRARLALGLGVKEVSRQLAAESGWPRRAIYRLAVDIVRLLPGEQS
jgi:16S rRNA (cytidine1402-2'-O)-methyltransferase